MNMRNQDTRSQILTTGRRLTAKHGYIGLGLGILLKEASVPKGSFYHYFASKEAYGCALLEDFVQEYRERLGSLLTHPALDARTRFLAYFEDWHQKQISPNPEDRCLVVRLSAEVADLSADMSKILQLGVAEVVAHLTKTLEQGIAEGSIDSIDDPGAMAEMIYHQWLGASLVASLSHDDAPLRSAMKATKRLIPPG
uniref:TetR/AcrR family transcriptional regulator n=1 Tax=uncultured Halomonas sp. TaxID=173971 RepID=UPI002638F736|nr:TetR/AcrR family transcriptional regulator [uncultured Halomonas sp.]